MTERFADWLDRNKLWLFAAWLVYAYVIHYQLIGYMSWDGFGYRTTPVVELMLDGDLNAEKFNDWAMVGHVPFLELLHVPFLKVFGMRGLLMGFPLVLFPLCVIAVYLFMRELTGSSRGGTLGAFAYVAIPMVNQQPFTGYVDFAVTAILAYWLYAMLRLRADERPLRRWGRLALATFFLTMSRSQGVYLVIVLAPILAYAIFGQREKLRVRFEQRGVLWRAAGVLALGAVPAIGIQIYKYYAYGSPIAPMQFSFLGIKIGTGVPIDTYFHFAGLEGSDLRSLAKGAFEGWIWHPSWPLGAFFASRFMATGLLFNLALLVLPLALRHATRVERWILAGGLLVSFLSKDFAVPRWSYTTTLALAIVLGRALLVLCESKHRKPWFWVVFAIAALHLWLRPAFDVLQIQKGYISPRLNVTQSTMFIHTDGSDEVHMLPNRRFEVVVLEGMPFSLQVYGQTFTNKMLGTIPGRYVLPNCEGLRTFKAEHPKALFIDDQHFSAKCDRHCVVTVAGWYCALWQINLAPSPQR